MNHNQEMKELVADSICATINVDRQDFDLVNATEIILLIANGMFWSAELHKAAIDLSKKVKSEFSMYESIPD